MIYFCSNLFLRVYNVSLAGQVHYQDPEDCLSMILKFAKKNDDMLYKCSDEVNYFLPRILKIARHFIRLYRLRRLTCQYLVCFLVSMGLS